MHLLDTSSVNEARASYKVGPGIFLDRDGVLCEDMGYLGTADGMRFLPGALDALNRLGDLGVPLVIVSNQSGIARALISEEGVRKINAFIRNTVENMGGHIDGIYYCPHHPQDGCDCRKPKPGLLERASRELGLDPKCSIMVGDRLTDVQAGQSLGAWTVLVSEPPKHKLADATFSSLHDAVPWIRLHVGIRRNSVAGRKLY